MNFQRKIHLYLNNTRGTACCPLYRLDNELRDLTLVDDIARWCAFIALPRRVQCDACAGWIDSAEACEWLVLSVDHKSHATKHHDLFISLFCGALAGALDLTLRSLVAEVCAARSDGARDGAIGVLLDMAEQRGLDADDAWPFTLVDGVRVPVRYETWLDVDEHGDPRGNNPHVWLPVRVDDKATTQRRCPCGPWLVGGVTYGGDIAGPKTIEHDVDVVLELSQGPRFNGNERILRCPSKNRFGPSGVAGHFELARTGFISVEEETRHCLDRVEASLET